MSVQAITWAFHQPVSHSSAKFVLVVMANCADEEMICWPSVAHLCEATGQDRKTVIDNVHRLREWGYLVDTGERKGATRQVLVYKLKTPESGTVKAPRNDTESGTVKDSQKRNSTDIGTVPFSDVNSPVFPYKESRFSVETVPKTGHGTVIEPSMNRKEPKNKRARKPAVAKFSIPDNFGISDRVSEWAKERGFSRLPERLEHFVGSCKANGTCYADWDQAFMNSIRGDWAKLAQAPPKGGNGRLSVYEQSIENGKVAKRMIFGEEAEHVAG